jgi:biopolymer transport protein ExbD
MAFGRLERRSSAQPISDINMTPLIDVMLVLLVIFIVTAPLMASSLRLDLPQAEGGQTSRAAPTLLLALDAAGVLYLDDRPIDVAAAALHARETARSHPTAEVQLRADGRVPYGRVAEVIGMVQQAGLTRIGFVIDAAPVRTAPAPSR